MSVRPFSRPTDFARRLSRVATVAGAFGAAGMVGCGATGANLAEADGGSKSWWSKPAALAKASTFMPPGLTADPIPSTREELKDPAALDLAYANLRTDGQPSESGRDDAEAAFKRVLKDDPKNVEALIGLARLTETGAGDRPGELKAAEDAYRKAVDAAPADARPLLALARFQADRGRWGESAATYGLAAERSNETKQRRTARHGMAVAMAMGGDIEGSRPHFVASMGEAVAHYNVGEMYRRSGNRDAALREFRLASEKDTGEYPQLARVGELIAALDAADPSIAEPASGTQPWPTTAPQRNRRPASAGLAATPTRPPVDPFAGDPMPFGAGPSPFGGVQPASNVETGAATAPAAYSTPQTPPAYRPTSSDRAGGSTQRDADVPPPWPFPKNG
ncbi:tetratricopeptide repeat protein [Alienimonas chondri]|uniref:Tetratricopeptide repeat protein n=1 Tax=Alienimonas chondri TaxID=2681879 RepID=A0ABX1VIV0_9PLAN|nr:hypothetical protein [Alienimonas chondri]NNJ28062.1 hypothetical protein [Alienimonas chondri]